MGYKREKKTPSGRKTGKYKIAYFGIMDDEPRVDTREEQMRKYGYIDRKDSTGKEVGFILTPSNLWTASRVCKKK